MKYSHKILEHLNQMENYTWGPVTFIAKIASWMWLWTKEQKDEISECVDLITKEFLVVLKHSKNGKISGIDRQKYGLLKYTPTLLHDHLLNFLNQFWTIGHIPKH